MGVELVTAYTGTNHVSSSQDGALYAGIVGLDNYVFTTGQKLQATMEDANTLVVASGNGLINGRHFEVTDTVSFTIPTGSQDMMTSNLAVIRYTKGADSVESVTPLVLTGEPVAENPQDPAYNEGSILDGVSTVDFPLYRVVTTGISAGEPEQLFDVVNPLAKASRFRRLWSGSVRNPGHPMTIPAPGIGDYSLVLVRGNSMNVLLLRDVGSDPQGGAIRVDSGNYACSITVTEWAQDSITVKDYIYSSHSNPTLGGTVTHNAGDWMTITGIWGIA